MTAPSRLRRPFMFLWLNALVAPIRWLYTEFVKYRHLANYKMEHNGQVVYLQKVLNDRFDVALKQIRISDGTKYDWTYLFQSLENKPQYLNKILLYDHLSYGITGADFQVHVPSGIPIWTNSSLMAEFRSLLNYYKLAGKRYKLVKGRNYDRVYIFPSEENRSKYLRGVHLYDHLSYGHLKVHQPPNTIIDKDPINTNL